MNSVYRVPLPGGCLTWPPAEDGPVVSPVDGLAASVGRTGEETTLRRGGDGVLPVLPLLVSMAEWGAEGFVQAVEWDCFEHSVFTAFGSFDKHPPPDRLFDFVSNDLGSRSE